MRRAAQAQEQPPDGSLAGARLADKGDGLAGQYREGHVAQQGARGVVRERDVLEVDAPGRDAQRRRIWGAGCVVSV